MRRATREDGTRTFVFKRILDVATLARKLRNGTRSGILCEGELQLTGVHPSTCRTCSCATLDLLAHIFMPRAQGP
eukprot:6113366-Lingulodinium_polyedra.AAC.1